LRRVRFTGTAYTCANPTTKNHPRVFTVNPKTILRHAKEYRCTVWKLEVLIVGEATDRDASFMPVNPANTRSVMKQ